MGPRDPCDRGAFSLVQTEREARMAADEARHYLRNGDAVAPAPSEALEWGRDVEAKMVDLKFCDLLGSWQHMTLPLSAFEESAFDEGLGFDGSSIRGWQGISESDMLLMPQAEAAIVEPVAPVRGGGAVAVGGGGGRPVPAGAVREGPARDRPPCRGLPAREQDRRH